MRSITRRLWLLPALAALLASCGNVAAPDTLLSAQARKPSAPVVTSHNPILFVHGWNSSGSVWTTMISWFKGNGWTDAELFNWSYDTAQSNVVTAGQIQAKVDQILAQTGATKVDIITHSMGGLSSRYYLKNLGGDGKVDAWVSLGGPNHGTNASTFCFFQASCTEMAAGSTFLTNLNSGDESPGTPRYATWWSPCDEIINPDSSVPVSGATNTQTACLSHSSLYQNSTVYAQVRDFVNQ